MSLVTIDAQAVLVTSTQARARIVRVDYDVRIDDALVSRKV